MDNRLLDMVDNLQDKFGQIDFVGTISKSPHHIGSQYPYLIVQDQGIGIRTNKVTILYASGVTQYSPGDDLGVSGINRTTQTELVFTLRQLIDTYMINEEN